MSRQIVLDTETTGLDPKAGHKIIEIGGVEIRERRLSGNNYHQYIQPNREIDASALEVHGITSEFLADKPVFEDIWEAFIEYVDGAQLIIHNAPFDVGFLNVELKKAGYKKTIEDHCEVIDSLALARKMYPGQRNSLDALCKRMEINNAHRTLHGALLDSEILADVFLRMTGGQTKLALDAAPSSGGSAAKTGQIDRGEGVLKIIKANDEELAAHEVWLKRLADQSEAGCQWVENAAS